MKNNEKFDELCYQNNVLVEQSKHLTYNYKIVKQVAHKLISLVDKICQLKINEENKIL